MNNRFRLIPPSKTENYSRFLHLYPIRFSYGERFKNKQSLKQEFGLSENKFITYSSNNHKSKTLILLESRLDRVLFKMTLAPTLLCSRQLISHGKVTVNGAVVKSPGFLLKTLDIVSINKEGKKLVSEWINNVRLSNHSIRENYVIAVNKDNWSNGLSDFWILHSYIKFSDFTGNKNIKSIIKYNKMTWLRKNKAMCNSSYTLRASYLRILLYMNKFKNVSISLLPLIWKNTLLKARRVKTLAIPSYLKVNNSNLTGAFIQPHISDLDHWSGFAFNLGFSYNLQSKDSINNMGRIKREIYKYF